MMGANWNSWETLKIVTITLLHITALSDGKSTDVTRLEGQSWGFSCEYPLSLRDKGKFFCRINDSLYCEDLIKTDEHEQLVTRGRFSLYDNTTAGVFIVTVDGLKPADSGRYRCGVFSFDAISEIQLNVSPGMENHTLDHPVDAHLIGLQGNVSTTPVHPEDLEHKKSQLSLALTVVVCVAALLFVCLFTVSLQLSVKQHSSATHQNREISSDYVSMNPGGGPGPELNCSSVSPDYPDYSALAAPTPPERYANINPKRRESALSSRVSLGLSDYVDVDVPGQICRYQSLDLDLQEEHIYQRLHATTSHTDGSVGVKSFTTCPGNHYAPTPLA